MPSKIKDSNFKSEEQSAVLWFIGIFYIISIVYDVFYYFIYKKYILHIEPGLPSVFGYWYYLCLFTLLPIVYYLSNKKPYMVKYLFFTSYIILSILNDGFTYMGNPVEYKTGNIAEILLILFSPLFVNPRFFWFIFLGTVLKYLFVGVLLQTTQVFFPTVILLVISFIAYVLLKRFQGYVAAIKSSYDKQLDGIVKGVIATIELKDPYTRGHSERVAYYAKSLAIATGKFSEDDLTSFHYACLLHDIGKVNIPDSILMKPGKLSTEEYEVIKTHPVVGAEAIRKVKGLGDNIDVILSHHERWDGKGYPEQLSGQKIPVLARVVSIADAFDAMTSSRSYRSALSVEDAYERIIEGHGTQFDPELVKVFKDIYPAWVDFHKNYEWPEEVARSIV
ncbi:HD-GYP domain-containing protein [Mesobacillus harenae]|uniref:HD-GYP domain-containing protein n=1 Tax=Mesobacillus harenae TaxID=2213203 RepID=UPI001580B98C|nr:HD-GYP domain-containing protein [Mesobacillus harenae]